MNEVICPNCRTVTPTWKYCVNCNAPIEHLLSQELPEQSGLRRSLMDPQLHRLVQRVQGQGISKLKTASTDEGWITVIARVTDLDAFKALDGVVVGAVIPPVTSKSNNRGNQKAGRGIDDEGTIVTARMPVSIVERVRRRPFVRSLKAGQRIRPWLENLRRMARAEGEPVKAAAKAQKQDVVASGNGGDGIIVGIVDFGMDFMHYNFRFKDGDKNKSRILALWDQTASAVPKYESPFGYGRLYTQADINAAIEKSKAVKNRRDVEQICETAYQALGYGPPKDSLFLIGAHGTYVADVAAGNGKGTSVCGLAPAAGIVFVEASTQPYAPAVGQSFGDSAQLLEAVKFIFDYADDKPCVVNLSLGTNGGPHDGSTLVELALDRLVSEKPNRAVVVAAGNAYGQKLHLTGKLKQGETVEIKWNIPENDSTPNELEVWYDRDDRFTVEVEDPKGRSFTKVAPGWQIDLTDNYRGLMTVVNRLEDPNNGDNTINVFFERGLEAGEWTLRIHGAKVKDGRFHAWIERDETGQARFIGEHKAPYPAQENGVRIDDECTLGSIACGQKTIVVGSLDAGGDPEQPETLKVSKTSSSGKTRDEREKPDIVAPGELILAACSRTLVLREHISGTSISAAAVTGTVALMLAEARSLGIELTADDILEILRDEKRKAWRPRLGCGCVSVEEALKRVAARKRNPNPANPKPSKKK